MLLYIRNGTIPESHFFNYLAAFLGSFPNFIHTRHIFLCGTKVAFLCGKSPVESGKPHLQNAAFPAFFVTALSPCIFALSPVLPVELYPLAYSQCGVSTFSKGYFPHLQHRFFEKKASCLLQLHVP
jgi:hypothetical protein